MPNFPFFRYPYYRYNPYNYRSNMINNNFSKIQSEYNNSNKQRNNIVDNDISGSTESESHKVSDSEQIFEIFGIKLHFDDILIIALLILLYNEGVKDYSLFISLILLLIS